MRNKNAYIIIYYTLLLVILVSRQNVNVEPPLVLRLLFISMVIIPCVFTKKTYYPAIITMFLTISQYGFAYSYMPYMISIYAFLTLIIVIITKAPLTNGLNAIPPFLVVFMVFIFMVDTITGIRNSNAHFPENITYCFLILLLFFSFTTSNGEDNLIGQMPFTFAITTIVLSLYFLLNRSVFIQDYGYNTGLERSGWTDPNYFGMVIGMGTTMGAVKMFETNWRKNSLWMKILYILTVVISIPVLLLNASRGALLSVLLSIAVLMTFSKVRMGYKLLVIIISLLGLVWLYNNQYFELLEFRIENDDGTGSNRITIWTNKLDAFFEKSLVTWLFGCGYTGGCYITGRGLGFHNEYIAFLVDYGFIGVLFLLYMLYYPIKRVSHKKEIRPVVVTLMVYLATCLLTLEPFSLGIPAFYVFYFYAVMLSNNSHLQKNNVIH